MAERKVISDNLESRLNSLDENKTMELIVVADREPGFVSLERYFSYNKITPLARTPVIYSFKVALTRDQVYALAEQPYVKAIMKNQRIHHALN